MAPSDQPSFASIKQKYVILPKKSIRIPGTFTRENPSRLFVDFFWICASYFASLVVAAVEWRTRRGKINFNINASTEKVDFSFMDTKAVARFLSEHPDKIKASVSVVRKNVAFLMNIVDPLPDFIANPSIPIIILACVIDLYFFYRFVFLHRNWRWNPALLGLTLPFYIFIHLVSPTDIWATAFISFHWVLPGLATISVVIHGLLRGTAWVPLTITLAVRPRNEHEDLGVGEGDEEDLRALMGDEYSGKES